HFVVKLFGNSEFTLRFISVLFGIINIFIVYKIARSFFSEEIAFITLILFSMSSYQIYYSQEARMYTMYLAFSLLIIYYFLISIKYNSFAYAPYIVFSVLGLYTHIYILFLIIIINLIYFLKYKEDIRENLWIKANMIILVFCLPLLPFLLKTIAIGGVANKVNIILAPIYTFKSFLFGLTVNMNFFVIMMSLFFVFLILISIFSNRRYKEKKVIDVLIIIALLFILIPWLQSIIGKPVYSNRTLMPVSFIFLLLSAIGISYLFRGIKITIIVLYLIFNFYSLFNYYFIDKYQKINYKKLFNVIVDEVDTQKKEMIIIHTNIPSYASFEYLNKFRYKTNFENRYLSEIPEYKGSKLKLFIRDSWRVFKEKFKIDIYAGYDKNILTENELKEKINNYQRIYLVIDDKNGLKQIDLPHSHVWETDYVPYKVFELKDLWWVNNFNIKDIKEIYGCKLYKLEKKI
ncbi:MAG: glycosyltransferase family 39 protein, partial [Candidatus Goldbacteria bacterium]|nr:glycosyltransferase family 39 protein [Candidatus Goldiibacteriota bacterium]